MALVTKNQASTAGTVTAAVEHAFSLDVPAIMPTIHHISLEVVEPSSAWCPFPNPEKQDNV